MGNGAIAPSLTVAEAFAEHVTGYWGWGKGVSDGLQLGRGCTSFGAGGDGRMWCAGHTQTHCDSRI